MEELTIGASIGVDGVCLTVTTFDDEAALRALAAAPPDPAMEPLGNFPLPWYEAFLKRIVELGINVVTYRDLFAGLDDHDHENSFPKEQKHWNSTRPKDRPTLIIQHDVDNHPFFTKRMVALEQLYGIRSNIFIFVDGLKKRRRDGDNSGIIECRQRPILSYMDAMGLTVKLG